MVAISKIEGLDNQVLMRTLYLQQNSISKIENLNRMPRLTNLNLSENFISKIENLSLLKNLQTLNLSKNTIQTVDDIRHLVDCTSIQILDLSSNRIKDPNILEEVIFHMKQLKYLKLDGNPFIREAKNYRRRLILNLPNLNYLDTMPVFPDERRCALAWERGGIEEEKRERELIRNEEKEKHLKGLAALDKMIEDHKENLKREQEEQEEREEKERQEQEEVLKQELSQQDEEFISGMGLPSDSNVFITLPSDHSQSDIILRNDLDSNENLSEEIVEDSEYINSEIDSIPTSENVDSMNFQSDIENVYIQTNSNLSQNQSQNVEISQEIFNFTSNNSNHVSDDNLQERKTPLIEEID